MNNKPWFDAYPAGTPHEIVMPASNTSLIDIFERNFQLFGRRDAFVCMDKRITYNELDLKSRQFAAYLQSLGLKKGARVAVMMPNVLQYPVALLGIIRAGYILVNVNHYIPRVNWSISSRILVRKSLLYWKISRQSYKT
jgi:long-chain acyl-CoA synthetase